MNRGEERRRGDRTGEKRRGGEERRGEGKEKDNPTLLPLPAFAIEHEATQSWTRWGLSAPSLHCTPQAWEWYENKVKPTSPLPHRPSPTLVLTRSLDQESKHIGWRSSVCTNE